MLILEDDQGLAFWHPQDLAAITPEGDRWRVVNRYGGVGFLPAPPTSGLWRRLGPSYVRPEHLTRTPHGWQDPAGFPHPDHPLQPLPAEPIDPLLGLEAIGKTTSRWHYDDGCREVAGKAADLAQEHPQLIAVKTGWYVNRNRLRRWYRAQLFLDTGAVFCRLSHPQWWRLSQQLGLDDPYHLPFPQPLLLKWRVREYPVELAKAPAAQLKAWFDHPRQLIANFFWQTAQYTREGRRPEYGRKHRAFYYDPVYTALYRAGFCAEEVDRSVDSEMYLYYLKVLEEMVGDARLVTFQELGFTDPGYRKLGDRRPTVLILCEKDSLVDYLEKVHAEFGTSYVITGGMARLLSSEFLAAELKAAGITRVTILAYVDFDPDGWLMPEALIAHLNRYGIEADPEIRYLVLGSLFTDEELELYSKPYSAPNPATKTRLRRWVERSGGIRGKGWVIHCNHFKPVARVLARVRELLP